MPYSDKEKQKEYQRKWAKEKYSSPEAKAERSARRRGYDRDKQNEYARKSYANSGRTKFIRDIKNNSECLVCGENYHACLDFHHLDPSTKSFGINSSAARLQSIELIKEMKKCIVLCANCHRKIHSDKEFQSKVAELVKARDC